jgi:hypothetical protein
VTPAASFALPAGAERAAAAAGGTLSGSQDGQRSGIFSSMRIVDMPGLRQLLLALLITAAVLPAAGCGRKAQPEPPPGADYPRTYPSR